MPDALETLHPRFGRDRWPERLHGQKVRSVDAYGKHLFLRFENDLTIHSHLRMSGRWRVLDADRRVGRDAWLRISRDGQQVVQFKGPVLELMTDSRTRIDQRIAGLGPDILADSFDYERFLRRLREDDPTRPIGDAVLDQRTVAGIGNLWRAEALLARPDRPLAPHRRGLRRRGARDRRRRPPAHAGVRPQRPHPQRADLQPRRPPVPALRHARQGARPVGRQPHDVLVPGMSALRRVGHKGADLIAPGNTRESFDAALAAGVDMIEFDVLPTTVPAGDDTPLVLAHDHDHALDGAPSLDEGLEHLKSEAFADVELDVDLKLPGYEARVVEALRDHDLIGRTLVSSQYMRSLVKIRAIEPDLRLGWSVPRVRRDYTKSIVFLLPALSALVYMRRRLPGLAAGHLGDGRVDAVMAHYRLASPQLVQAVHDAGGELYVWTVDDAEQIRRLEAMGADAVITNDPRLFA